MHPDSNRSGWVPIFPRVVEWWLPSGSGDIESCSRTMLPLKCCWAWTYWKAQGQTITSKVVYKPGNLESEHGISYVLFSYVQRFNEIDVLAGILGTLLNKSKKHKLFQPRLKFEEKLDQLENEMRTLMES